MASETLKSFEVQSKSEFAACTKVLRLGILSLLAASLEGKIGTPEMVSARKTADALRDAIKAAPFVADENSVPTDATPETKAAENAVIDECFASIDAIFEEVKRLTGTKS